MCGIAGRFHPAALPSDPAWGAAANKLLFHRGPDGEGHYEDSFCQLVHRRLSLIDLSDAGRQPMANEDDTVFLIFNGEIYNYRELRRELLGRGHRFKSQTDSEVIIHLYEEVGEDLVGRLRGMFAFAIYDRAHRSLLLARDRFGIKPLYYARSGEQWVFASEIKAILAVRGFEPTIDRQACYDFLGLGYIPEPQTGFANVHALPKGSTLVIGPRGVRSKSFHSLHSQPRNHRSVTDAASELASALTSAVESQRVADVPVAALLSGGIDSSLVVAAYCRGEGSAPLTFNVRFPDVDYDETALAMAVSKRYGTRHETIELPSAALDPDLVVELLHHFDQPFADTSLIPTYWISRAIRDRGIIATLSGDAGDEAFGGYAAFWRANRLVQLLRMPEGVRAAFGSAARILATVTPDAGRQLLRALDLARAGNESSARLIASLQSYVPEEQKRTLVRPEAAEALSPLSRLLENHNGRNGGRSIAGDLESLSSGITEACFDIGLPSDMLRKVDMMSMRASLEVRVPMLDEDVVDLGVSLTHRLKTDGRRGKLVLRSLAEEWLPPEVARHPKHGFGIPLDVMLNDRFMDMISDTLLAPGARIASFIEMSVARRWVEMFRGSRAGARDGRVSREGLYQRIFMLLSLELWLRRTGLSW